MTVELVEAIRENTEAVARLAGPAASLLVRQADVPGLLGVSLTAFKALRERPGFPPPVAVGIDRCETTYRRADLEQWARQLPLGQRPRRRRRAGAGAGLG